MIGTIGVTDLAIQCIIGQGEEERRNKQNIQVDVDIRYDVSQAIIHDSLAFALDYSRICDMITEHLCWQRYHLLESACAGIITMLRQAHPDEIIGIHVRIRKPRATKCYYAALSWSV